MIPAAVLDRWDGPAVDQLGRGHPAQRARGPAAAQGRSAPHQGRQASATFMKVSLIGEVYNLFNHANYSGYVTH